MPPVTGCRKQERVLVLGRSLERSEGVRDWRKGRAAGPVKLWVRLLLASFSNPVANLNSGS